MITVVDYGSGNTRAILNIYNKLGIECATATNYAGLKNASKLILPGVGAFDETIALLRRSGFVSVLDQLVQRDGIPVLGICVGMQIMADSSEEGCESGLGWIRGQVRQVNTKNLERKPRLPHMGWNSIQVKQPSSIFQSVDLNRGFYFLHSYYFSTEDPSHVLATTTYGEEFSCAVHRKNIYGVQFHPEKSHWNGVNVMKNFASL